MSLRVLWPIRGEVPATPPDGGTGINNVSVVLLGEVGPRRFLLMGDVEEGIDPLRSFADDLPHVDFLKVAHHGSRTATTEPFVEAVQAKVAVASAGTGNPYGHPAASTLARLAAAGARVLRTDRDGTVVATFGTDRMTVETEGGGKAASTADPPERPVRLAAAKTTSSTRFLCAIPIGALVPRVVPTAVSSPVAAASPMRGPAAIPRARPRVENAPDGLVWPGLEVRFTEPGAERRTSYDTSCDADATVLAGLESGSGTIERMTVPGRVEAATLLLSLDPPAWLVRHSRAVAEVAVWLAARDRGRWIPVDRRVVEGGALLHDADKALPPDDPAKGLRHGDGSAAWLTRMGYPELARAVANHPVTRLADEEAYRRWAAFATREERVVAYADKRAAQRLEPMAVRFDRCASSPFACRCRRGCRGLGRVRDADHLAPCQPAGARRVSRRWRRPGRCEQASLDRPSPPCSR